MQYGFANFYGSPAYCGAQALCLRARNTYVHMAARRTALRTSDERAASIGQLVGNKVDAIQLAARGCVEPGDGRWKLIFRVEHVLGNAC